MDDGAKLDAGWKHLVEVATPPGGVFACAIASNLGPVQNPLDAPSKTGGRFRPCLPNRIENAYRVCRGYIGHRCSTDDGGGVGIQRIAPLLAVFLVPPRPLVPVQELGCGLIERNTPCLLKPLASPLSITSSDGITTGRDHRTCFSGQFPRRREAYIGIGP